MSMRFTLRLLSFIMIATLTLSSCVSKKKFQELMDEKSALANSLSESQKKVNMLEDKVTSIEAEMASEKARLNGEIAGMKKDLDGAKSEAAKAKSDLAAKDAELAKIKKEIKDAFAIGSDVKVESRNGGVYVVLDDAVKYTSGSARLNRNARKSVEQLATTMKNNPNMHLLIEGHTDSDKYPRGAAMDNWQLSVNRSMNVVKRLIRLGVKPEQLTVAGRGDANPAAPNDSKDGKSKNRRTEAKANPNSDAIFQISN